jgi:NADPH-dependent 7-cyano-7-deazaguanine reductase QueF-like protein
MVKTVSLSSIRTCKNFPESLSSESHVLKSLLGLGLASSSLDTHKQLIWNAHPLQCLQSILSPSVAIFIHVLLSASNSAIICSVSHPSPLS